MSSPLVPLYTPDPAERRQRQQIADAVPRAPLLDPTLRTQDFTAVPGGTYRIAGAAVRVMLPPPAPELYGKTVTLFLESGAASVWQAGVASQLSGLSSVGRYTFHCSLLGWRIDQLPDTSVTAGEIANGAVTTLKLADNAITSAKIVDGAIATADIANSAVTYAKQDQFAKGWEENISNPWWFDDMFLISAPTATGIIQTRQGNWRFTTPAGTWAITQPVFNNASGNIRFDPDNVNPRSFELRSTIAGGAPFRFEDLRSVGARIRLRSTITGILMFFGVFTNGAACAMFEYLQTTSVNLRATTRNGAGVSTSDTSTGIVWGAGDSHHLRIERAINGDLTYYVDGTLTNTVTAATHGIANTDGLEVFFAWQQTTNNGECEVDYIGYRGGGR